MRRFESVAPKIQEIVLHACIVWVYECRHTGVQTFWRQPSPFLKVIREHKMTIEKKGALETFIFMWIGAIPGRFFQKDEPTALAKHILEKDVRFPSQHFASATFTNFFHRERAACLHLIAPPWIFLVCFHSLKRVCFSVSTRVSQTLAWSFEGGPPCCASF